MERAGAQRRLRRDQAQPVYRALEQIHTANTSIGVLRAVCEVLLQQTSRITIVESDGGRYPAEAAFENNGVYALAAELGLKVLNLSKDELIEMPDPRLKGFGMARSWLEADAFVTLPASRPMPPRCSRGP